MDKKSYYLVRFDTLNPEEDFQMIVSFLSSVPRITISSEKDQVFITYPKAKQQAILKKTTAAVNTPTHASMMIQCDISDYNTLQIFREIAPKVKYRIYNPNLGCFLPKNINLFPISEVILPEKITQTFHTKKYTPLFNYYKSDLYYAALLGQQCVHRIQFRSWHRPWRILSPLMTAEKSALHLADKVRPGETLDTTIKRILREEVKMADDYVRAKVTKIEFDRDKENKLTPRLWVSIYLKEIKNKEKIEEKAQRGWTSLKSETN